MQSVSGRGMFSEEWNRVLTRVAEREGGREKRRDGSYNIASTCRSHDFTFRILGKYTCMMMNYISSNLPHKS